MIMVPIKEALTFDDVTLAPKYSEILPSEVNTGVELTKYLKLKVLPINIFEIKKPLFEITSFEKIIASLHNSPV